MSSEEARLKVEATLDGGHETMRELMELMAPDHKPRLQSFCRAGTNQEPHLPLVPEEERVMLTSDR